MEKRLTATAACWGDVADTLENLDLSADFCRAVRAKLAGLDGYQEVTHTVPEYLVPAFEEALEILSYEGEFDPAD